MHSASPGGDDTSLARRFSNAADTPLKQDVQSDSTRGSPYTASPNKLNMTQISAFSPASLSVLATRHIEDPEYSDDDEVAALPVRDRAEAHQVQQQSAQPLQTMNRKGKWV
jgi:hypothetical protein